MRTIRSYDQAPSLRFLPLLVCLLSQNFAATSNRNGTSSDLTISTNVDLVALDVGVKDRKGGYVSGLTKDNFRIYENGKVQPIKSFSPAANPGTVGPVIHKSGTKAPRRARP